MFKKLRHLLFKLKLRMRGISEADLRLMILNQKLLEHIHRSEKRFEDLYGD